MDGPIESYLAELRRELRGNPLLARRVIEEVRDHLAEAAREERGTGMTEQEAEERAVGRFGPPARFARRFDRFAAPFRALLLLASVGTVCVALWLVFVIAVVLPARDPGHIAFWSRAAAVFFGYCALTWAYLIRGPRNPWLRGSVLLASLGAIAAGLSGIGQMIRTARSGGHFEGYIILIGLVLCAHGLSALAYTVLARRLAREVGAVAWR